jgi:hypothetical protein
MRQVALLLLLMHVHASSGGAQQRNCGLQDCSAHIARGVLLHETSYTLVIAAAVQTACSVCHKDRLHQFHRKRYNAVIDEWPKRNDHARVMICILMHV